MSMSPQSVLIKAAVSGLRAFYKPPPLSLSKWAEENFYLSKESSYVEQSWKAFPYQVGILDCISNDDIEELDFIKSARVGYTKIILAAIAYFASHKRRNQAIWQPVDGDAIEFVKTELSPMIRDIQALRDVAPWYGKKSSHDTLDQKMFTGSALFIRGGKSAKNYRRISVDVVYLDELDAFDKDVDGEGRPDKLAKKRNEGSVYKKFISGSTPKIKDNSLIEKRADQAKIFLRFYVPCPKCGILDHLKWGGKDVPYGVKWKDNDPETAYYLCKHCGDTFDQSEYLEIANQGRWQSKEGVWLGLDGLFRTKEGELAPTPHSVAFHIWTIYSELTEWSQIAREFIEIKGDRPSLKTFVNTTLGESWKETESDRLEHTKLYERREHYQAQVPDGVLYLTVGIDTQDDRFEIQVDGWGIGEERWGIDFERLYGDPSRQEIWDQLAKVIRRQYTNKDGVIFNISLACQDHGGSYSDEVNAFSKAMGLRFLVPVKGLSTYGNPVATWPRERNVKGVYLTGIGTDTAKDLLYQRLKITKPGPGYWHWPVSDAFDETYFKQLTAEECVAKWIKGGWRHIWDSFQRRNEAWDCSVYSLAAVRIAQQHMGLNFEDLAQQMEQINQSTSQEIQTANKDSYYDKW
ncbi:MAG: phage terminase large subunit family protein [Magnetococcales bacterium]|nr:phage terminase large subunit family protein [Magnetococcales bacterium]